MFFKNIQKIGLGFVSGFIIFYGAPLSILFVDWGVRIISFSGVSDWWYPLSILCLAPAAVIFFCYYLMRWKQYYITVGVVMGAIGAFGSILYGFSQL